MDFNTMSYGLSTGFRWLRKFYNSNKTSVFIKQFWIPISALRLLVSQTILYSI